MERNKANQALHGAFLQLALASLKQEPGDQEDSVNYIGDSASEYSWVWHELPSLVAKTDPQKFSICLQSFHLAEDSSTFSIPQIMYPTFQPGGWRYAASLPLSSHSVPLSKDALNLNSFLPPPRLPRLKLPSFLRCTLLHCLKTNLFKYCPESHRRKKMKI